MSYAIITGASKGIGKAIAEELSEKKFNVLLVARSEILLKQVCDEIKNKYKVDAKYFAVDLSADDAPDKIFQWCEENKFDVSVLVNNAGYGLWGKFNELSLGEQLSMMNVNINSMIKLTHLFLPALEKQKQSYILNVASTTAYQAVPALNVYAASKSFVILFSRALKYELKDTSVSVTCLSPGTTTTNFMNQAGMKSQEMINKAKKVSMSPEAVAKFAVSGMLKKKNEIIPGFINQFSVMLTYFVPKWVTEKIAASIYKK